MKRAFSLIIIVTICLTFPARTGFSLAEDASNEAMKAKVDELLDEWDKPNSPGFAFAVIKDGDMVYNRCVGMANLDYDIPITPSTVFDIASMAKQFTAACIVLLVEEGKISLDDDIRKYIPEFPDYSDTITIRHLIHHTSGIRDYTELMLMAGMSFEGIYEAQEIFDLIFRQKKLNFSPGEQHSYSNSGYILLGLIIERVTGLSLSEYAAKHIFEPLGMGNTFIYDDRTRIIKNRAIGYTQRTGEGYRVEHWLNWTTPSGDGYLYTTVEDMLLWDRNFYDNKIGGPDFNTLMLTRGVLNNGDTIDYAFGLKAGTYRGLKTWRHSGGWAGFRSLMIRFPEQKLTTICLANVTGIDQNKLCTKAAEIYLAGCAQMAEPVDELVQRAEVSVAPAAYDDYTGEYELFPEFTLTIAKEGDELTVQATGQAPVAMSPESETEFFVKAVNARISFDRDESGEVNQLTLHQGDQHLPAKRIESEPILPLSADQLAEFAGEYYSDELGVTYIVVFDKDHLRLDAPKVPEFAQSNFRDETGEDPLKHIKGDQFMRSCATLTFKRDDQDKITGFGLDVGGDLIGLRFIRR
jgi:CubicO group peptidase (beta-lactamase class C family)